MEYFLQNGMRMHAFLGGLGLVASWVALAAEKGGRWHKIAGRIFSYAMGISVLMSLFISTADGHQNKFLFLIGIFTLYMILSGNRVLTFKNVQKEQAQTTDYLVAGVMLFAAVTMVLLGIIRLVYEIQIGWLYLFFGSFAAGLSIQDLRFYRNCQKRRQHWVILHIGRMTGAAIAALTAFLVTALAVNSLLVWILPTIFGTAFIIIQSRKWTIRQKNRAQ
jgi:uncharacterized membrane protein